MVGECSSAASLLKAIWLKLSIVNFVECSYTSRKHENHIDFYGIMYQVSDIFPHLGICRNYKHFYLCNRRFDQLGFLQFYNLIV